MWNLRAHPIRASKRNSKRSILPQVNICWYFESSLLFYTRLLQSRPLFPRVVLSCVIFAFAASPSLVHVALFSSPSLPPSSERLRRGMSASSLFFLPFSPSLSPFFDARLLQPRRRRRRRRRPQSLPKDVTAAAMLVRHFVEREREGEERTRYSFFSHSPFPSLARMLSNLKRGQCSEPYLMEELQFILLWIALSLD